MSQPHGRLFLRTPVLSLLLIAAFVPQITPGQSPSVPPVQWPRSHDYDVQHYRIEVGFDWGAKVVQGSTTITLRPFRNGLKEIEVDAGKMKIDSVRLAGGAALKFRYDDGEHLYVILDRAYPAGADLSVAINYRASPEKGLTFILPTPEEPNRPRQIWSQGESQDNHYWFPCYDYPNDKATTDLIAHVEDGYQVISNGVLVSNEPEAGQKTRAWHWKMDRPYSSYLVSIIVGKFAEVKDTFKGIPVVSYVYPDEVQDAHISFGKIAQMVAFFSEKTGVDFPYAKYAQTTVRDFGGGMENITATTLTDTSIHDKRAHLDISSDGLISHELAHSWFGDLLTCRDWGELWLNESFATFMEAAWTEHDLGTPDYLYEMYGNQQGYLQAWAQGNRRPIVVKRYSDPDSLFDAYPYPRGGAVIHMLRFVLGDELFWRAINHYVKKHQYQNVETQDLVAAIEEATGQNLQWFFDEWLYRMGHPEFEITSNYDAGAKTVKLTVKQTQKPDEAHPWFQSPEFFTMPVEIAVTTSSGEHIHRVWIDARDKTFTFEADSKPLIVNFDRGNVMIKQVKFDRPEADLAYQLLNDTDVMGRVRAAIELKTHKSDVAVGALAKAATTDVFWAARLEAVRALGEMKIEGARAALLAAANDKDSRIRHEAIHALGQFKDAKLADLYIKLINSDPSYFVVAEAAQALGESGSPRGFEVLTSTMKVDSWQETIRAGALRGIAALKDPRAFDIASHYSGPGHSAAVRAAALQALAESGENKDRAFSTLSTALKDRSLPVRVAAAEALSSLGDPRAVPLLEEAAKSDDLPGLLKQIFTSAIKQIREAASKGEKGEKGEKKD